MKARKGASGHRGKTPYRTERHPQRAGGPKRKRVQVPELGKSLGEELLTPTRIYVKPLLALMDSVRVHAISHITGGGFYENVPRMLQDGFTAEGVHIERQIVKLVLVGR